MRLKIYFLVLFLSAVFFSISCVAGEWKPPADIIGTWTGSAEVFARFKKGKYPSGQKEDWIEINVMIRPDGKVDGKIGNAKFVSCRVRKNRGWLGRKLNMKSDFIVSGGALEGRVVPEDEETRRQFTIPFNIVDGKLKGGFMVLKKWEYPYPLFPRLNLEKKKDK